MKFYRNIKTKWEKSSWLFIMILLLPFMVFSGCQSKKAKQQSETGAYYTCSMHPQIHKDKPGDCPICGMKLIKVEPSSYSTESLDSMLDYLTEPVTQTVVGAFKVIEPVKTNPGDTITAEGFIGFDKRDVNTVSTRVTGRIEKLHITYTNQFIRKGQPLMDIYSPQLLSAQRDLLQALHDNDTVLINGLKKRVLNLGMHASEIQRVIRSGQPLVTITLYSPYNGISRKTNQGLPESTHPELLNIRKGMYVNMGQVVFSIQNLSRTWAILNVFTDGLWHIHPGDAVRLNAEADPRHIINGRVDFIPPYRSQDEKTTRIRVYLSRLPEDWKIGMLIHGQIIASNQRSGVYIPLSAVNRLGKRNVVWVQEKDHPNVFHARDAKIGIQTGDSVQIIAGIQPGDKIAANAAYMVGSDSFIE